MLNIGLTCLDFFHLIYWLQMQQGVVLPINPICLVDKMLRWVALCGVGGGLARLGGGRLIVTKTNPGQERWFIVTNNLLHTIIS